MTDDTYRACRVRHETGTAVRRLARARGGKFTGRPLVRSDPDSPQVSEPEPLAGIAAAVSVEREARRIALEYVRYAREDGLSWREIAAALGLAGETHGMTDDGPAVRAFRYAAPARGGWFPWSCPSCRQQVRDHGPELAPHDAEQGHAEGCERFAATLAEWDRQWGDE